MKLLSYLSQGKPSYGVVKDGKVHNVGRALGANYPTLRELIAAGAFKEAASEADRQPAEASIDQVTYLPVIGNPGKILCVGLNYLAHREETGRKESGHPTIFTRFANTQVGHNQPMIVPRVSTRFDYEGELAVIIGKAGRHVSQADALAHVAGYACYNDGSVRDWQNHNTQWIPGKNFVGSGGFGPWMVTGDEIPDPTKLTLTTRLNGEQVQHSTTDLLIFSIPEVIAYITTFTELEPGDVIASGTPGGVGAARKPPLWMKPGDVVEVEITGIGTLRNPIVAELS